MKSLPKLLLAMGLSLLVQNLVFAETSRFVLNPPSSTNANQIKFTLAYTLGTHIGKVYEGGEGFVNFDPDQIESLQGEFNVPIDSIRTGNDKKRDCHLRESLGLNYVSAGYPEKHICDSSENLPVAGPQSIQYPYVKFTLQNAAFTSSESAAQFASTRKGQIRVNGVWNIHGVSKAFTSIFNIELSADGKTLLTKGDFDLQFADFGIIVKSVQVLGFEVAVEEVVNVKLNLVLNKI